MNNDTQLKSTNNLEIKKVPFMGAELMAARDEEGQIWAGVRWMCDGVGLSQGQTNREINKIREDEVLKEGYTKFGMGVFDPNNPTIALKLDFVPLWLAKINITPTMRTEHPELAESLKQYQLKAKDVLANAFLPGGRSMALPQSYSAALRALADEVERNEALEQKVAIQQQQITEMKPKVTYYDVVLNCKDLVPTSVIAKDYDYGWSANRMNKYLHEAGVQYKQGKIWLLYQSHAEMGYTNTRTIVNKDKYGNDHAFPHTYWTQKGRLFIYELLKGDGILPTIERGTKDIA